MWQVECSGTLSRATTPQRSFTIYLNVRPRGLLPSTNGLAIRELFSVDATTVKLIHDRTSRAFLVTIIAHPAKQACSQDMRKQAHYHLQSLRSLLRILQSEPKHDTEKITITTNSVDVCKISYQHQHQHNDKVSRPALLTFAYLGHG